MDFMSAVLLFRRLVQQIRCLKNSDNQQDAELTVHSCILEKNGPEAEPHLTPPARLDKNMRYTTQFLLSALSAAQFPTAGQPEIAFLGRSNVGKSSLLNALVGEKAAKVSSTPGRTRAINFFQVLDERRMPRMVLADLPGYGYAKISKSISAEWPKFIEPYMGEREQLKLSICLVDSNIAPQESDLHLLDWLREAGREFVVVATKADRLSGNERTRNLAALKKGLDVQEILAISSKTKAGLKDLWAQIEERVLKASAD